MSIIELIILGIVILGVAMVVRHLRENPTVDMNHQAPNVHNAQMKGKVGPPTAADKPAVEPAKKAAPKKPATKKAAATKATTKKTTKKTATKKKPAVKKTAAKK